MSSARLLSPRPHLIAAMVTPFTATGDVDRASLQRLVAHLRKGGIDELFALGSTGEAPLLDGSSRGIIIETVRSAAPNAVLHVGISGTGHRQAVQNARDAAAAGADVAVLMSPFFLRLDQEQLEHFCVAVADDSPIPLTVYHHLRMPTPFTVTTVAKLASHPNIIAIKDTNGGEHDRCAEILAATMGQSFLFLQGVEKLVLPTLQAGGHGCVVAQGCIAPHLFRALFAAWEAGEQTRAREVQQQVDALWAIFSRPEVKQSFHHFLHTLKFPLHERGVLASTAGALPRLTFAPEFEQMISRFMREHLDAEFARPTT
jgi:dihydrodipicolinate synthase/N-acetylneuraminate lyase